VDGEALAGASRLVAKVDSAAVQDGFDLYLHGFIVADDGKWTVVQQGMNGDRGQARRYHWLSEGLTSFVDAPHAAIEGPGQGAIVNLADRRAEASRRAQLEVLAALGAEGVSREFGKMAAVGGGSAVRVIAPSPQLELLPPPPEPLPHLQMPAHHDVRAGDVVLRRLHGNLAAAEASGPQDFAQLLQVPGVGARTVRALALVAEVLHGAPCRFTDPARFSIAHGGKDRHPFPVPTRVLDHTIGVLKSAVRNAKLGREEELQAIRRLDAQARALEREATGPALDSLLEEERTRSHEYGGRSIFGWARPLDCEPLARERPSARPGKAGPGDQDS
jgi:uncharacterized protein